MDFKKQIKSEIEKAISLKELEQLRIKYLAKKGKINQLFKELGKLPQEERKNRGIFLQKVKKETEKLISQKQRGIKNISTKKGKFIDITLPGEEICLGHIHPLSQVFQKSQDIFERMGFAVVEGPELETEWYNFDALNFPKDHPAREMQDTFWVKEKGKLMRTHTSAVQVRYMEKRKPPYKTVVPGRIFRNEATDASHEMQFNQLEGLMIDKKVSVVDFNATINTFFEAFFEEKITSRIRPSYFPFTEPSFEYDLGCVICKGKGCSVCKKTGWLEIVPGGMVHPNVLKNSGLDPKKWQGFAFGMGMDRLAMIKYKINDIRLFNSSDLRFLNQF